MNAETSSLGRHADLQPSAEESAKVILSTEMIFGAKGGIESLTADDFPTPQLQQIARFVRDTNGRHFADVVTAIIASDMQEDEKLILRNAVIDICEYPQAMTKELLEPHLVRLRHFMGVREAQFEEWKNDPAQATMGCPNLLDFPNSDAGNAERLHAIHGRNLRYVSNSGQWLVWDRNRWMPDSTGQIVRMFLATMRCTAKLLSKSL